MVGTLEGNAVGSQCVKFVWISFKKPRIYDLACVLLPYQLLGPLSNVPFIN